MRKFIILAIYILFIQPVTYSQWYPQSSGTIYPLNSVYFINEDTGFICGYNRVLKTTNAGTNWAAGSIQGNHRSLIFTNESTGFICSDSGKIFKTINSGINWQLLNSATSKNLTSINFINSSTGIVTGYEKTILKTTNAGESWVNIANFVWQVDFLGSKLLNPSTYYISGANSFIMKTTDGGNSWLDYTHGDPNPLFAIEFINNNTGWATGCCGMFMATTNAGINWSFNYYLSQGFTFHSMKFINNTTGYISGSNGMIYRTTNAGIWWDSTQTTTDETIYSVYMNNNNTGWAVGGYGTILKTTNGGGQGYTIGVNQTSNEVPDKFLLMQNYPNPFNPETKILFSIPESGYTELKIYNINGKEVQTILNRFLNVGTYEIIINANSLSTGVYFYRLANVNSSMTRKMMVIK